MTTNINTAGNHVEFVCRRFAFAIINKCLEIVNGEVKTCFSRDGNYYCRKCRVFVGLIASVSRLRIFEFLRECLIAFNFV